MPVRAYYNQARPYFVVAGLIPPCFKINASKKEDNRKDLNTTTTNK